jgi:hypothetical protein
MVNWEGCGRKRNLFKMNLKINYIKQTLRNSNSLHDLLSAIEMELFTLFLHMKCVLSSLYDYNM